MNGSWRSSVQKKRVSEAHVKFEEIKVVTKKLKFSPPPGVPPITSFFAPESTNTELQPVNDNSPTVEISIKKPQTLKKKVKPIEYLEEPMFSQEPLPGTLEEVYQNSHKLGASQNRYYLDNFMTIIDTVSEKDVQLLNETDMKMIQTFKECNANQRSLIARLYYRKGPWFSIPKLNYKEIYNIEGTVAQLLDKGIFEKPNRTVDLLDLMTNNDLKLMLKIREHLTRPQLMDKAKHWLQTQTTITGEPPSPPKQFNKSVKLKDEYRHMLKLLHRLFFLNQTEDQSMFMMIHTGKLRFPTYMRLPGPTEDIHPNDLLSLKCKYGDDNLAILRQLGFKSVFKTRKDLELYEEVLDQANNLRDLLGQDLDIENDNTDVEKKKKRPISKDKDQALEHALNIVSKAYDSFKATQESVSEVPDDDHTSNLFLRRFTSEWVYSSIVWIGVGLLERKKQYKVAVQYLQTLLAQKRVNTGRRGEWWIRLALDLAHLKMHAEAIKACKDGLSDEYCRPQHLLRLKHKLGVLLKSKQNKEKKKEESTLPHLENLVPGVERTIYGTQMKKTKGRSVKSVFIDYNGQPCSVEDYALCYYTQTMNYPKGMHCEGDIFVSLFALTFWDILFDINIPFVFQTPYQDAPLDLTTEAFYETRKDAIEKRLMLVENSTVEDLKSPVYAIIRATYDLWVGRACRGLFWERYSRDDFVEIASCVGPKTLTAIYRRLAKDYRFTHSGFPDLLVWDPAKKICKFSEVKGPRDKLSEKQILWIDTLAKSGADIEVLYVKEKQPNAVDDIGIAAMDSFFENSESQLELLESLIV